MVKNLPAKQDTCVRSLGWEASLEKEMATHYSILAWEIQWTEGPGGLWSVGLQRIRHDFATKQQPPQRRKPCREKDSSVTDLAGCEIDYFTEQ